MSLRRTDALFAPPGLGHAARNGLQRMTPEKRCQSGPAFLDKGRAHFAIGHAVGQ